MKRQSGFWGAIAVGAAALAMVFAGPESMGGGAAPAPMKTPIVYRDPFVGAPLMRVDGCTRGVDDALLTLTVLAPEHVGLTIQEQPTLYWYQSRAANTRFELTILEGDRENALLEVRMESVPTDGIQKFRLSEHGIKLKVGIEYRWTVAMVIDAENRSRDVVASGVIKRVAAPETLAPRLAKNPQDAAFIYADEGIWYDSLTSLSDLIDQQPRAQKLHELRGIYFLQAGLKNAAEFEMRLAAAKR